MKVLAQFVGSEVLAMFGWWAGLPAVLRYGVAVGFLLVSTVLWLLGTFWPWGWVVGLVLLMFAGPSDAEKKGYHDF